jgi:hypothetical protein
MFHLWTKLRYILFVGVRTLLVYQRAYDHYFLRIKGNTARQQEAVICRGPSSDRHTVHVERLSFEGLTNKNVFKKNVTLFSP